MLYNGVLVSAVSQSESAIRVHTSPNPLPLEMFAFLIGIVMSSQF